MVRECRPPARKPTRSWLARRSTMATSTFAHANSAATIRPVGPPPAITTACSVIAAPRPAWRWSPPAARRHGPAAPRSPAARTPAPPRRAPATAPRVPPSVRRPCATHTSTTTHAFRYSHFRRFWLRPALCSTTRGLRQAPRGAIYWKWKGVGTLLSTYRPPAVYAIHPSAWKRNSRKFTVANGSPTQRQPHDNRPCCTPLTSKRSDLVLFVAPLCIKGLRLVTGQLPEKSSPIGPGLNRTSP